MPDRSLPHLLYNWISAAGAVLAGVCFGAAVLLLALSLAGAVPSPYLGVVIYLLLPAAVVFGLVLIPIGAWHKSRRIKKGKAAGPGRWPLIDLNNRRERNAAIIFVVGSTAFVLASIAGVYEAFSYTESVSFCGRLCHTVMKPQYVTHGISPHAHVACTGCHVGPGVGWYANSKIRGVSRVYGVATHSYPRPIPIPIADLRPTELECHHCHWPNVFYGRKDARLRTFMYDKENTYWPIDLVIHIGGGDPAIDRTTGIHWYMNIGYRIELIALDKAQQKIAWVAATNKKTGKTTVYHSQTHPLSKKEIASATPVEMDCISCHNAPTHRFHTPDYAIDMSLATREIDPGIPSIKAAAVSALAKSYESQKVARAGIAKDLDGYYSKNYQSWYEGHRPELQSAIEEVGDRFRDNVFPYMKTSWKAYPDNIGHFYSRGCFRCHLGDHQSDSGETISHDCRTCHEIMAQGSGKRAQTASTLAGLSFEHPVDIGGAWKIMACSECHTGVQP